MFSLLSFSPAVGQLFVVTYLLFSFLKWEFCSVPLNTRRKLCILYKILSYEGKSIGNMISKIKKHFTGSQKKRDPLESQMNLVFMFTYRVIAYQSTEIRCGKL